MAQLHFWPGIMVSEHYCLLNNDNHIRENRLFSSSAYNVHPESTEQS